MSGVHKGIARAALDALDEREREVFAPFLDELLASSTYPDVFADKSMTGEQKRAIDPDAEALIYPDPPEADWFREVMEITNKEAEYGISPLRFAYLVEHYLERAVEELKAGNAKLATKLCGVYSHVIGDIGEPIHAVHPEIVDLVVPPPPEYIGFELHANVEGLGAPVDISGYKPRLLGESIPQAAMNGYAGLVEAKELGAAQAVPITQALYRGEREAAVALSARAQNESARKFADFLHTVIRLWRDGERPASFTLDLCEYPFAKCNVDMLYRYRPMADVSLIPYSGGKFHPLSLPTRDGRTEKVHGLGVVPYLGPPMSKEHYRETSIDYFLVPGAFETFRARVGANPLFDETRCAAVFRVICDGKELFRSVELTHKDPPAEVEVALGDARRLTLAMHYSVNPTREDVEQTSHIGWALHGVWAEPRLESRG